jgi:hypothetical protein
VGEGGTSCISTSGEGAAGGSAASGWVFRLDPYGQVNEGRGILRRGEVGGRFVDDIEDVIVVHQAVGEDFPIAVGNDTCGLSAVFGVLEAVLKVLHIICSFCETGVDDGEEFVTSCIVLWR